MVEIRCVVLERCCRRRRSAVGGWKVADKGLAESEGVEVGEERVVEVGGGEGSRDDEDGGFGGHSGRGRVLGMVRQ